MTARAAIAALVAAATVWVAPAAPPATAQDEPPPADHVVLIGVDGFDPDYLGRGATPNLDALAARGASGVTEGVMLPITNPSFTALTTGAWPDRSGNLAYWWDRAANTYRGQTRVNDVTSIAEAVVDAGGTVGASQYFILQGNGTDYGRAGAVYTQPGGNCDRRGLTTLLSMLRRQPVSSGGSTRPGRGDPDPARRLLRGARRHRPRRGGREPEPRPGHGGVGRPDRPSAGRARRGRHRRSDHDRAHGRPRHEHLHPDLHDPDVQRVVRRRVPAAVPLRGRPVGRPHQQRRPGPGRPQPRDLPGRRPRGRPRRARSGAGGRRGGRGHRHDPRSARAGRPADAPGPRRPDRRVRAGPGRRILPPVRSCGATSRLVGRGAARCS